MAALPALATVGTFLSGAAGVLGAVQALRGGSGPSISLPEPAPPVTTRATAEAQRSAEDRQRLNALAVAASGQRSNILAGALKEAEDPELVKRNVLGGA